jgi:broad specificity phosphatase PhoE
VPVILLARHGQTSENAAGRILGRRDPPLSEQGRADAAALGRALAGEGLRAVWASPLRRARETAEIAAAHLGLETVVLHDLAESRRGGWEGRTYAELAAQEPALLAAFEAADPAFAFPGGESLRGQLERTRAALEHIAAGVLPALAVAHAGTIRAALALRGRPAPPERALPHGGVLRFDVAPPEPVRGPSGPD